MKRIGLSRAARRSLTLPFLYLVMFGLPQLFLGAEVSPWYWLAVSASIPLGYFAFQRGSPAFQFYYVFFVFFIMLGYLIQSAGGIRYIRHVYNPTNFGFIMFPVLTIHFLGLIVGAMLKRNGPRETIAPAYGRLPSSFWLTSFSVMFGAIILYIAAFGTEPLLSTRKEIQDFGASGTSKVVAKILKAMSFVLVAFLAGRLRDRQMRRRDWVVAGLALIFAISFANPSNTARYISLTGVVLAVIAWLGQTSKARHLLSVAVLSAALAIIVLPTTSLLRHGLSRIDYTTVSQMYSGLEFSSLQMLIDGVRISDELPSGTVTLSGFLALVPPPIFPASLRETTIGTTIATKSGYVSTNAAVPSLITGYLDGGMIGLFLFSIMMGAVLQSARVFERTDMRNRRDGYALILFSCIPIFARGDFSTAMSAFFEFSIAYEMFRFVAHTRFGRPAPAKTYSDARAAPEHSHNRPPR